MNPANFLPDLQLILQDCALQSDTASLRPSKAHSRWHSSQARAQYCRAFAICKTSHGIEGSARSLHPAARQPSHIATSKGFQFINQAVFEAPNSILYSLILPTATMRRQTYLKHHLQNLGRAGGLSIASGSYK